MTQEPNVPSPTHAGDAGAAPQDGPTAIESWLSAPTPRLPGLPDDDDFARALLAHAARVPAGPAAAACARLVAWTLGARRGEWHRGLRALDDLGQRVEAQRVEDGAGGAGPVRVWREALAAASGVEDDLPALGPIADLATGPDGPRPATAGGDDEGLDDVARATAWAEAGQMLVARDALGRATALFLAVLEIVETGVPANSPALRALAEAGEGLAAALAPHARRDHEGEAAMRLATEAARRCRARLERPGP